MLIIIIITDISQFTSNIRAFDELTIVHESSIKLKKLPKSFLMMCKGSKEIKQYSE